jgi:hypothetical protein
MGVTGIRGAFRIAAPAVHRSYHEAHVPYERRCVEAIDVCPNEVFGNSEPLAIPAAALILQEARTDSGEAGLAAGDIFIHVDDGQVKHDSLGAFGASALTVHGSALRAEPKLPVTRVDEWSLTVRDVRLAHWNAVKHPRKGVRLVTIDAHLEIAEDTIQRRLEAALRGAEVAHETAVQARVAAAQAYEQALATPDESEMARDILRVAETEEREAGRTHARAEAAYDRALRTERSRLERLLACDRVALVTHSRTVRARNGRDAAQRCRMIAHEDRVDVSWEYEIGRYEIPVGMTYGLGRDPHTDLFAAQSLTVFDPR